MGNNHVMLKPTLDSEDKRTITGIISCYQTRDKLERIKHLLLILIVLGYPLTPCQIGDVVANSKTVSVTHGPVVGAVAPRSAKVFVRTKDEAKVIIRYSPEPDLSEYQQTPVSKTDVKTDFTTQVTLFGLTPSTPYYLDVVVDGQPQLTPPYPRFKTFPPRGVATSYRLVVLTDFKRADSEDVQPVSTFVEASNEQPDFVYIGGDFDHRNPTTVEEKRQMFKDLYTPANNYEDFVFEILRKYAVVHNWDDHDFGHNLADKHYPFRDLSLEVLETFFPVYPLSIYGNWQRFDYGHTDFFLLDSRAQRDPATDPPGPDKSMLDGDNLGPDGQFRWLKDGLLSSTATWKFILTPVVFNPTNPTDAWSQYLDERGHLVDFIKSNNIEGVILISGDRHAGAIDDGTNSDFPEMLVPGVNLNKCLSGRPGPGVRVPLGVWSEGTYESDDPLPCRGYGVVTVLTDPDRVILEVKDDNGATQLSLTVHRGSQSYLPIILKQ